MSPTISIWRCSEPVLTELANTLKAYQLTDPAFRFLLEPDESGEVVALHCRASSYHEDRAELRSVCAIPIRGNRIITSRHLHLVFPKGDPIEPDLKVLLHAIGSRPLVGYYLNFSVALLDKYVRPLIGITLPNRRIEVSHTYYERKAPFFSGRRVDLKLNSILADLDLPERGPPDAYAHALAAALIHLKLNPPVAG